MAEAGWFPWLVNTVYTYSICLSSLCGQASPAKRKIQSIGPNATVIRQFNQINHIRPRRHVFPHAWLNMFASPAL
jgi:hypothetical protein